MQNISEIALYILVVLGAIAVSYVENCIISEHGDPAPGGRKLSVIYWYDLPLRGKLIFWTGVVLLIAPLFAFL